MDIIEILQKHLEKFKSVLELGSKKGQDLEILHGYYEVVASEDDKTKTRYLKDTFLDIRVILLDFINIDTHKRFDCIFSRNLFDDVSLEQLETSLEKQKEILYDDGLIFHIFNEEKVSKEDVKNLVSKNFEILEFESFDSNFYILAKS